MDLQKELNHLLDPVSTPVLMNDSLDAVRLGLTAHAEAEDIVLGRFEGIAEVAPLIARARAAHLAQEGALAALVSARPGSAIWRDRATHLRDLVHHHARQEECELLPALRSHAPRDLYAKLAGAFATERLRQLASLQPSAPLCVADFVRLESRAML